MVIPDEAVVYYGDGGTTASLVAGCGAAVHNSETTNPGHCSV